MSTSGPHSHDIIARRYGVSPSAQLGLDARAAAADAAGDWKLGDHYRYWANCLNEACALVALQEERPTESANRASPSTAGPATGASFSPSKGIIKGRVPYRPDDCPAWIDQLFPEGEVTDLAFPAPLQIPAG